MKIRTDFVTNSSSSSYITARIDCPVLADILWRLKMQLENPPIPEGPKREELRRVYKYEGLDSFISVQGPNETVVKFDTDGGGGLGAPRDINDLGPAVYEAILTYADNGYPFKEGSISVLDELKTRSDEIAESAVEVNWRCGEHNWGEFEDEDSWEWFTFDRATGESSFSEGC